MISSQRNTILGGGVLVLVIGIIAFQMYQSLAPPRHADHDHAMASLDAGGFLRIESAAGKSRNLVGRPGRVLILHFFVPQGSGASEQVQAARFAADIAGDPAAEILFVARARSWDGIEEWAKLVGVPTDLIYLDKGGATGDLLGVQRWPETLIYAPNGELAHQARGSVNWSSPEFRAQIQRAHAGVSDIH